MPGSIPRPWGHDLTQRQTLNDGATQAPLSLIGFCWNCHDHLASLRVKNHNVNIMNIEGHPGAEVEKEITCSASVAGGLFIPWILEAVRPGR